MGYKRTGGFTLLEVLFVATIIVLLATVIYASLSGARTKARDTERISELENIQLAFRIYKDQEGAYPSSSGAEPLSNFSAELGSYMPVIPQDPQGNDYMYDSAYDCDGTNEEVIYITVEEESNVNWDTVCNGSEQWYGHVLR